MLERLPVHAEIVVLTETALLLVRTHDTLQWRDVRLGSLVGIVIVIRRQWIHRTEDDGRIDDRVGRIAVVGICTATQAVDSLVAQAGIEVETQPLADFRVQLRIDIVLLKVGAQHDALVIRTGIADVVFQFLAAAIDREIVHLLQSRAPKKLVLPVVAGLGFPNIQVAPVAILARGLGFILILRIVIGIQHLDVFSHLAYAERGTEVDGHLPLLAALGGHDDDTIGTTGTIDGRGRGILQHINALNVGRSDVADARHGEAIDNIKR